MKSKIGHKYVALAVQDWRNFSQDESDELQVALNINAPRGCIGYLPVYDSLDELWAVLPNADYISIDVGTVSK